MFTSAEIDSLTQYEMASAAHSAGVEPPRSNDSRNLIRNFLRIFTGVGTPTADAAETTVTRGDLAQALNGLTTVVRAATQGVNR
jgi:hypothetical protein